jgi:ankyrin repeat protein
VYKLQGLLQAFPNIRIPGEDESDAISQEVERVIAHRINLLSKKKDLEADTTSFLEKTLKSTSHRTYLWVYLVFDYLENTDIKTTSKGFQNALKTSPKNVYEAYEQILSKSTDRLVARKALSIILAASQPLTVGEMNVAMSIDKTLPPDGGTLGLDVEVEMNFKKRLKTCCGLFISIYDDRIYLLHQTAREFLLADSVRPTTALSGIEWQHSITSHQAHATLAELCVRYLDLLNSGGKVAAIAAPNERNNKFAFLDYSVIHWAAHFREAGDVHDDAIVSAALRICDPNSKSYQTWLGMYKDMTERYKTGLVTDLYDTECTTLIVVSCLGHNALAKLRLDKGAQVDCKDTEYRRPPLAWAAANGHAATVELLLQHGAEINAEDKYCQTSLWCAAANGHAATVELLLEHGAEVNTKDSVDGRCPLSVAAENGYEAIVKLLVAQGANVNSRQSKGSGWTALSRAISNNRKATIEILLDNGAILDPKDGMNLAPLVWAAQNGHEAIVKRLLEKGAKVDTKEYEYTRTPLSWAAENGHKAVMELLLAKGAVVDSKDVDNWTPLSWAASYGHEAIVELLLENGAKVDSTTKDATPLLRAAESAHEAIFELLLKKGAPVDPKNAKNRTPLSFAARLGYKAIVELLLKEDAEVDSKDCSNRTPLSYAAQRGHEAIVNLLLDHGADIDSTASRGHEEIVDLLHDQGIDPNSAPRRGLTPLWFATTFGRDSVKRLLLARGATKF